MSEPIWNQFLTERDKAVFAASGYGARGGFGKRPALLVIDVNYAFCGDKPEPILESIKRWRNTCGEESWPAVAAIRTLIDKCHEKGLPVIYTTGVRRDDNWDSGSWSWKNARGGERPVVPATNVDGNEIVAEIAPAPQDIVVAEEGCFDRSQASHAINLCDMNAKYADVVKTAEVLDFMDTLPEDLFDLPKGTAPKMAKAAGF